MLKKIHPVALFKALDTKAGTFEALVSVFGNVDYQGDRVMPGAFEKSIKRIQDAGDPLPVIWSHDWQDPFAHIGYISPEDLQETEDGLVVKGQLDIDTNEFAAQVYRLLKERRVKEWSFGYDVYDEAPGPDRANELRELDIIETGPTLKGANSLTQTLGVKQVDVVELEKVEQSLTEAMERAHERSVEAALTLRGEGFATVPQLERAAADLDIDDITAALSRTENTEVVLPKADEPETKAKNVYAPVSGSLEEARDAVCRAVDGWAETTYPADEKGQRDAWAYAVATFDDRVVVEVNEYGEDVKYLEFPYTVGDDGAVTLGDPASVDVELTIVSKEREPAGRKAGRVIGSKAASALKSALTEAVDEFVSAVNGDASSEEEPPEEKRKSGAKRREDGTVEDSDAELMVKLALLESEIQE